MDRCEWREEMKIDQILHELNQKIAVEYGVENAIHKITMSHEAFDNIIIDFFRENKYSTKSRIQPSSCNDVEIVGIRLEARPKSKGGG